MVALSAPTSAASASAVPARDGCACANASSSGRRVASSLSCTSSLSRCQAASAASTRAGVLSAASMRASQRRRAASSWRASARVAMPHKSRTSSGVFFSCSAAAASDVATALQRCSHDADALGIEAGLARQLVARAVDDDERGKLEHLVAIGGLGPFATLGVVVRDGKGGERVGQLRLRQLGVEHLARPTPDRAKVEQHRLAALARRAQHLGERRTRLVVRRRPRDRRDRCHQRCHHHPPQVSHPLIVPPRARGMTEGGSCVSLLVT